MYGHLVDRSPDESAAEEEKHAFWVQAVGFRVWGFGLRVQGIKFKFRLYILGFSVGLTWLIGLPVRMGSGWV